MKTQRAQPQNGDGAEVIIRRSVAGEIAYDVKAVGATVEAAGARARQEFELMRLWAERLRAAERAAVQEEKERLMTDQLARSAKEVKK